ncbi:MAG: DUF2277 domain-containing protein [Candidatus Nanopelagicales bacterium]
MCRNITTLRGLEPPPTEAEVRAAAVQYVRKVSGVGKPSPATQEAFDEAVESVAAATSKLIAQLPPRRNPPAAVPPSRRGHPL